MELVYTDNPPEQNHSNGKIHKVTEKRYNNVYGADLVSFHISAVARVRNKLPLPYYSTFYFFLSILFRCQVCVQETLAKEKAGESGKMSYQFKSRREMDIMWHFVAFSHSFFDFCGTERFAFI